MEQWKIDLTPEQIQRVKSLCEQAALDTFLKPNATGPPIVEISYFPEDFATTWVTDFGNVIVTGPRPAPSITTSVVVVESALEG